ncbi:hypothetical protein ES332_D10G272600v1 [Gossypium tomentosum]|uniref:Uncharacterized protein n=1 Tax=Gossypium tomentosum TaxID=34277 RepID=A0A5D2J9A4_GOSTO|nr:hypothetical protein ES332_D10G272600v1 [Gossypium tomentosum]
MLLKDGVYATQPVYSVSRVNSIETNQFNKHIGSSLPEDGVYTTQPVYLELQLSTRVNLVRANNRNGHIGSSLPRDGVYTAKPVYLECRVNSLQKNTLNGHVGSSLQDELLSLILQRPQQQEGLLNQPTWPIPAYPLSETGTRTGTGTSISSIKKQRALRRQRPTLTRTRYGLEESSSSFKRFRREPSTLPMPQRYPSTMSMPMPILVLDAKHENRNLLSMHNETNTSSNASNLSGPRPILNSLYGPLFEGIELPVNPHLRMFATM